MSWTSSRDVDTSIGMTVGREVEISFMVNPRYPASITLVIGESTTAAEISFNPAMVETLRDKADEAVRECGRQSMRGRDGERLGRDVAALC